MSEEKKIKTSINQNTEIRFTLKAFIGTIGTILGIFIGFYTLVIQPKFESHETKMESIIKKVDNGFDNVSNKLIELNNGMGVVNGNIEGINNRFRDLNQQRQSNGNSGGSFGN